MADSKQRPVPEPSAHDWAQLESAYGKIRSEEPPGLVDLAILNRAHREVVVKPKGSRVAIWAGGFSTACLFALAIGLTLRQSEELTPATEQEKPQATAAAREESATTLSANRKADADAAQPAAPPAPLAKGSAETSEADQAAQAPQSESLRMQDTVIRSPEAWLEHIRNLQAHGLTDEAKFELEKLREAYPEFPLPADLSHPE